MKMKRYVVEQNGIMQLEAARRFLVEVPDHFTEDQTEALLEKLEGSLPDEEGMEWTDGIDRKWLGVDVEIDTTNVYDPDSVAGARTKEGLKVITLEDTI
jgi:hypothetical protein